MEIVFSEAKAHTTVKQLDFRFVTIEALGGKKEGGNKKEKKNLLPSLYVMLLVMVWLGCLAALMGNFLSPWDKAALVESGM